MLWNSMEQENRLDFLLKYLIDRRNASIPVPSSYAQKRELLRALVNVRPPRSLGQKYRYQICADCFRPFHGFFG